ncbi:sensor domain-containing diguanylate cyclase [Chitinibacter sp. SCUT-21]|uniref:sensor domain-containing diguanylate cyclase n=1 Tax=Chitinibacter sp. SCUT-21 TaxID=2970891 RepID=UPI0035A60F5F
MIFLLAYQASMNFTAAQEKARSDNQHLAVVVENKIATLSREVALTLGQITDQWGENSISAEEIKARLSKAQSRLPQVDNFALVQADGKLNLQLSEQKAHSLEQDFFPLFKLSEHHSSFLTSSAEKPVALIIGQRFETAEGAQLLLAHMNRSYLQTAFASAPRHSGQELFLLDASLNVIAALPTDAKPLKSTPELIAALQSKVNPAQKMVTYESRTGLINLQQITGSDLIIVTQFPAEVYLNPWQRSVLFYVFAGCLVLLLTLLMAFYFWRSQRLRQNLRTKQIKLSASEARFRQMIETTPVGLVLVRIPDFFITYINQPGAKMFGWPQAAALSKRAHELYYDRIDFIHHSEQALAGHPVNNAECLLKHREGTPFWANVSMSATHTEDGSTLVIGFNDITPRKRLEEELKHRATTDSLSGLANRAHFMERAQQEIARAKRYHHPACVMMLDIDFFKKVNDQYGHQAGDAVIKTMAQLCKATLRDNDLLARIGGEEFTALLPETKLAQAYEVAERLRRRIESHSLTLDDHRVIHFTTSIGISELLESDTSIEAPLKRADEALYVAKRNGRNQTQCYEQL